MPIHETMPAYVILMMLACVVGLLARKKIRDVREVDPIQRLKESKDHHETSARLWKLLEHDGAGTWPPKSNHDNWPQSLKAYKSIYFELAPSLSVPTPSLDDKINNERRNRYRTSMRKLLADRIDLSEVTKLMQHMKSKDFNILTRDAINGFYCCIASSRHAYRWAVIPVVTVAQLESVVDFPPELDVPWRYLQRYFDVDADSGNNTANLLHNFDENGKHIYKVNVGQSDLIASSEETFARMFYDLEVMAFPIYCDMAETIINLTNGNKSRCLEHLQHITYSLRGVLKIFYDRLTEARISRKVWLSYVQGFQGWGVGRVIDGKYVKFDGLSGNHVLIFQALDAFLGIEQYLTDDALTNYIPGNQRELCASLRRYGFRGRLNSHEDKMIEGETAKIIQQLRVFRAAHKTRVMPYLKEPAPERLPMTAGKSLLDESGAKSLIEGLAPLVKAMTRRLQVTM